MRICLILLFVLTSFPVHAGAWMREKGKVFGSTSYSYGQNFETGDIETMSTWFAEYGVGNRFNIGTSGWTNSLEGAGFLFTRLALSKPNAKRPMAVDLGLGFHFDSLGQKTPITRLGFSIGQGLETKWGPGWMQLETAVEKRKARARTLKADLTFGVSPNAKATWIMEIQTQKAGAGLTNVTLAPSYVRKITKKSSVVLGIDHKIRGQRVSGLRFGTWLSF